MVNRELIIIIKIASKIKMGLNIINDLKLLTLKVDWKVHST